MKTNTEQFNTGAVRSKGVAGDENGKFPARFDLIPPVVLRKIAETYGEGALKYSDNNWMKGIPESNLLNHALAHINSYMTNGYDSEKEDDLSHAIWNLISLLYFNMTGRSELLDVTSLKVVSEICEVCDGGPGNTGTCVCGHEAYESKRKTVIPHLNTWHVNGHRCRTITEDGPDYGLTQCVDCRTFESGLDIPCPATNGS